MYLASPSVGEDTDAGRLGTPPGELADQPVDWLSGPDKQHAGVRKPAHDPGGAGPTQPDDPRVPGRSGPSAVGLGFEALLFVTVVRDCCS